MEERKRAVRFLMMQRYSLQEALDVEDVLWRLRIAESGQGPLEHVYNFLADKELNPYIRQHARMAAELRKQLVEEEEEDLLAHDVIFAKAEAVKPPTTSLAKCGKCSSSDVLFCEKQTRSADEAATQFFTCLTCRAQWRKAG